MIEIGNKARSVLKVWPDCRFVFVYAVWCVARKDAELFIVLPITTGWVEVVESAGPLCVLSVR